MQKHIFNHGRENYTGTLFSHGHMKLDVNLNGNALKGIVSRDCGRLQMVLLDRSEVRKTPLDVSFILKFIFQSIFFKIVFGCLDFL
jgi:hypothetical protein